MGRTYEYLNGDDVVACPNVLHENAANDALRRGVGRQFREEVPEAEQLLVTMAQSLLQRPQLVTNLLFDETLLVSRTRSTLATHSCGLTFSKFILASGPG